MLYALVAVHIRRRKAVPSNIYSYNFSMMEETAAKILTNPSAGNISALKNELNRFFKDSSCKDVIYTRNTDKPFFGLRVYPILGKDDVVDIMVAENGKRVKQYCIEIDSKIRDLDLTQREFTAFILHEVGHLTNDSEPSQKARDAMNVYLAKKKETIAINQSAQYRALLAYAFKDAMVKASSLFYKKNEEVLADEFVVGCGYGEDLYSGLNKVVGKTVMLNRGVEDKFTALQYVLSIYKNIKMNRIRVLRTMNKCKQLTGSELEKKEYTSVVKAVSELDDVSLIYEANLVELFKERFKKVAEKDQNKTARSLEDDIFEFSVRVKNVQEEDEALMLLRQLNTKMAILDDYIQTGKLEKHNLNRYTALYAKYGTLRDALTKKDLVQDKYWSLFVELPMERGGVGARH
jgi:DNA-binding Lrp family transcriptional regulator